MVNAYCIDSEGRVITPELALIERQEEILEGFIVLGEIKIIKNGKILTIEGDREEVEE